MYGFTRELIKFSLTYWSMTTYQWQFKMGLNETETREIYKSMCKYFAFCSSGLDFHEPVHSNLILETFWSYSRIKSLNILFLLFQLDMREPNVLRVAPTPLYNSFKDVYLFVELLHDALKGVMEQ